MRRGESLAARKGSRRRMRRDKPSSLHRSSGRWQEGVNPSRCMEDSGRRLRREKPSSDRKMAEHEWGEWTSPYRKRKKRPQEGSQTLLAALDDNDRSRINPKAYCQPTPSCSRYIRNLVVLLNPAWPVSQKRRGLANEQLLAQLMMSSNIFKLTRVPCIHILVK